MLGLSIGTRITPWLPITLHELQEPVDFTTQQVILSNEVFCLFPYRVVSLSYHSQILDGFIARSMSVYEKLNEFGFVPAPSVAFNNARGYAFRCPS